MKKIIILLILCFLTAGCASNNTMAYPEIKRKFKAEGFKMVYHRDREKDIDILSFESENMELFYNSKRVMGVIKGNMLYSPSTNKGYANGLSGCIYNFRKQETGNFCYDHDLAALKKLKKQYKNTLKKLNLTEKQFYMFAKHELRAYLDKVASLTDEQKLERIGFKRSKDEYQIHFETDNEDESPIPNTMSINLKKKQMDFKYESSVITLEWANQIIVKETYTDGTVCAYDITNKTWLEPCDEIDNENKFYEYYDFFQKFQKEYQLSL